MKKIDLGYLKFSLDEILLIGNKRNETKLGFAVLYKYFQLNHRFPQNRSDIPDEFINYIGKQVGVKDSLFEDYDWNSRSTTYHRKQIRNLFGFREYAVADSEIEIYRSRNKKNFSKVFNTSWIKDKYISSQIETFFIYMA